MAVKRIEEIRLEAQGLTPWWVEMSWEVGFVDQMSERKHKLTNIEVVVVIEMCKYTSRE